MYNLKKIKNIKFSSRLKQCKPVYTIFKYITVFNPSEETHFIDLKKCIMELQN